MKFPRLFVGRSRELQILRSRLESLRAGESFVASVVGEPGIGKTTFCSAVMQIAGDLDAVAVRSTSVEHGGTPPYWLWQSVLTQLGVTSPFDLDSADAQPSDSMRRAQQEFQIFEKFGEVIRNSARERPIVIVLEDLHWADDESLRLLAYLVTVLEGVSVGVIATYRDQFERRTDASRRAVLSLVRAANFESIRLDPFTKVETQELVSRYETDSEHDVSWSDVYERSGGNPLFASELSLMSQSSSNRELSGTLQMAVEDRLGALDSETIDFLEICALSPRKTSLMAITPVANRAGSASEADVARFIDEGIRRQFFVWDSDDGDLYGFRHSIVREVIAARVGQQRKSQIHASYVAAIEEEFPNQLQEHAEELVFHAERARPAIDDVSVVRFSIFAAREAMKSFSFTRASELYTRVIELSYSDVVSDSLAEAMHGIVIAGSGSGRDSEIAGYFAQAFRYYVDQGMIDLALEVAQIRFIDTEGMLQGVEVYEAALELVEPDSRIEANVLGRLGRSSGMVLGDYPRAKALLEKGIGIAQQLGDFNLEMQLCGDGVNVAFFNGEYQDSRDYCSRIERLSAKTSDPLSESGAYLHMGLYELAQGATAAAIDYLKRSLAQSLESHLSERISSAHKVLATAYIRTCQWDLAREHVGSALELFPSDERVLAQKATIAAMTGDIAIFEETFSELVLTDERRRDSGEGATARYFQMACRAAGDEKSFAELERSIAAIGLRTKSTNLLNGASLLGKACLALESKGGDFARLREQLIGLRLPTLELTYLPGVTSLAGMIDEADAEFDRFITSASESGQLYSEAWLRFDYAAHLVRHSKGETVIAQAIASGRRTAAKGGITALAARFDSLENEVSGRKKRTAGLTARELEILRLMYSGQSNPEIAERLTLSRHTVVRHLSNIFTKLEVANRTEASKAAVELGLV